MVIVSMAWETHICIKLHMRDMVQQKMADAKLKHLQEIRADGKSAAASFWRYVCTMHRQDPEPLLIDRTTDVEGHLSIYLSEVLGKDKRETEECIKLQQYSNQQGWTGGSHPSYN